MALKGKVALVTGAGGGPASSQRGGRRYPGVGMAGRRGMAPGDWARLTPVRPGPFR